MKHSTIDDLPFTDEQKAVILEWFADKVWQIIFESTGDDAYYKSYDPLKIKLQEKVAMSYVLHLENGTTHHPFKDLQHLERMLIQEAVQELKLLEGEA
jgi:hypothetical protein